MLYRGKDKKDFYLASLLYDSIEFRHIESVTSLLTVKGADPNIVLPKKGISPFHLVIGCDCDAFALEVTSLILQYGGNPNVRSDEGLTPVHIAAAWGKTDLLRLLLRNGGDPELRDISRKSPLHYAADEGFTECIDLLKAFLPSKTDLTRGEKDSDVGKLIFDKVLVNNGVFIGEYNAIDETPLNSITPKRNHLTSLPQTDTTEYILNWFSSQRQSTTSVSPTSFIAEKSNSYFECSDGSLAESDCDRESKRYDSKKITFRKMYRKTRSKSKSPKPQKPMTDETERSLDETEEPFSELKEYSKESGVMTLSHRDTVYNSFLANDTSQRSKSQRQEKSSDYLTCSQNSINSLERNVFEITDDLSGTNLNEKSSVPVEAISPRSDGSQSAETNEQSFVSVVSEVYKYIDEDQGVVLYERRLLKTPSEHATSIKSSNVSSNPSSLPQMIEYDSETLRRELRLLGYEPGPITLTTRRVYLKKLYQLKKHPDAVREPTNVNKQPIYSQELRKTLRSPECYSNISRFRELEEVLAKQFSNPDPSRKWREGVNKSSFTYLLLDPRITNNLPSREDSLTPLSIWETFLSSIFYVGKGKRSRPYQHLYEALDLWKKELRTSSNKKLQKIMDIWQSGGGVICLHVFSNTIPVEAYTREAAMISAIKLENLTNVKSGEFYGLTATWTPRQKSMLGVYLLHKAMMIFLQEGERQLCPDDID